jgi:hypothetical protein
MDNEKRLQEIKKELDTVQEKIDEKFQNDPTDSWDEYCDYMKPEWDRFNTLDREKRMLMTPKYHTLPEYGDVMSLKDFILAVKDGMFIDSDGHGNYCREDKESDISINPSDVRYDSIRDDFDTVIWFNK